MRERFLSKVKRGSKIAMILATSTLLIAGSTVKWAEAFWYPELAIDFVESFKILLVAPIEFVVGVWLLSGLYKKTAMLAAAVLFGLFAVYLLTLLGRNEGSCGCFGSFSPKPMLMFVIDLIFATCLCYGFFTTKGSAPPTRFVLGLFSIFAIGLFLSVTFVIQAYLMVVGNRNGEPIRGKSLIWVTNERPPFFSVILKHSAENDSKHQLQRAMPRKLALVIFDSNCSDCLNFIKSLSEFDEFLSMFVVYLHIGSGDASDWGFAKECLHLLQSRNESRWAVRIPAVIRYDDGKPIGVFFGKNELESYKWIDASQ